MNEQSPVQTEDSQYQAVMQAVQNIKGQISRAMVGQTEVIDQVMATLIAGGHALLEGVPGLGKTLLVQAIAKSISCTFTRIQFTPDLMPADVAGHTIYDMQTGKFKIRKGPVFTNILLADEINRAPAKTQSALLEVMQEYQVTIDSNAIPLQKPFMTLATQNPLEQEGTYPLPEAQLDRFLLKVLIDYPKESEENLIVKNITTNQLGDQLNVQNVQSVIDAEGLVKIQKATAAVKVDDRVIDYAVRIVRQTRQWPSISIGAGPLASIAVVRTAKALAILGGRQYVIPDDVKAAVFPALRHRIFLTAEMEIEGNTTDTVLTNLLESIEAPRV